MSEQTGQTMRCSLCFSWTYFFFFFYVTRETEAEVTNAFNLSTFSTDIFGPLVKNKAYIFLSLKLSDSLSKLNVEMLSEGWRHRWGSLDVCCHFGRPPSLVSLAGPHPMSYHRIFLDRATNVCHSSLCLLEVSSGRAPWPRMGTWNTWAAAQISTEDKQILNSFVSSTFLFYNKEPYSWLGNRCLCGEKGFGERIWFSIYF